MSSRLFVDKFGVLREKSLFQVWLNKPYPLVVSKKFKFFLVSSFALFTYLFLLIYQPFGASQIEDNSIFLSGFGVMVFTGLYINYFFLPFVFKAWFDPEKWSIKKEIIFISWSFLLISLLNFVYNSNIGFQFAPQHSLLEFIGITFSVGVFPLVGLIYTIEYYLNQKNKLLANQLSDLNAIPIESNSGSDLITLKSENKKADSLIITLEDFLFAQSDNNYTTFYFFNEGVLYKKLMRLSLKNAELQLADFDEIIRCHRSYLVNKLKIQKIKGNARSLTIKLTGFDSVIPVSRSFSKDNLLIKDTS